MDKWILWPSRYPQSGHSYLVIQSTVSKTLNGIQSTVDNRAGQLIILNIIH